MGRLKAVLSLSSAPNRRILIKNRGWGNVSKPVSMIELFYDLVFVYMISKATGLIHHLHHGVVEPFSLIVFAFVVIVFINSWMVQSVFVNRRFR